MTKLATKFDSKVLSEADTNPRDPSQVISLRWNNKGTRLAYSKTDSSVRIWKLLSRSGSYTGADPLTIPKCHEKPVGDLSWDPKNEFKFATVGRDQYIKIWELSSANKSSNQILNFKLNNSDINSMIRYSRCGDYLAVITKENTIRILKCNNNFEELISIKLSNHIYDFNWSTISSGLFFVSTDLGDVMIFKFFQSNPSYENFYSIELLETLKVSKSYATNVIQSPDGKLLVVGSNDGRVSIFDMRLLACIKLISSLDEPIGSIDISNDSKYLAITSEYDECAKIFDLTDLTDKEDEELGKPRYEIKNCKSDRIISLVKFSPTDLNLLCHSGDLKDGHCSLLIGNDKPTPSASTTTSNSRRLSEVNGSTRPSLLSSSANKANVSNSRQSMHDGRNGSASGSNKNSGDGGRINKNNSISNSGNTSRNSRTYEKSRDVYIRDQPGRDQQGRGDQHGRRNNNNNSSNNNNSTNTSGNNGNYKRHKPN